MILFFEFLIMKLGSDLSTNPLAKIKLPSSSSDAAWSICWSFTKTVCFLSLLTLTTPKCGIRTLKELSCLNSRDAP